eukprot:COSAG05_NODE_735_length_7640_cov_6.045883_1_plen_112_part_00
MSVSALRTLVAQLAENQAAAAEAARTAAAEAKEREERNAMLLQNLLTKIAGDEESASKDEGAKIRSSSARSIITEGIKALALGLWLSPANRPSRIGQPRRAATSRNCSLFS